MLLVTLSLTSCLREIETRPRPEVKPPIEADADADTDADSDADSDADTDTDPVEPEDCGNGKDDDQDGLTDCEDEDCVDVCFEDCGNDEDDDGDGDVDCADDECIGTPECEDFYEVSLELSEGEAWVAYGPGLLEWAGYEASGWVRGAVRLEAVNGQGDSFECRGWMDAGPPRWGSEGVTPTSESCGGCDWSFDLAPRVDEGSLQWNSACPVSALPGLQIGFRTDKNKITADLPSGWVNQYIGGETYWGWDDSRYDIEWGVIYELSSKDERTWTGEYK
jgi:hypothetical protein